MRPRHHRAPPAVVPIEHIWVLLQFNSSRSCYMRCSVDAVELGFQGDIAQMCGGAELGAARQLNIQQAEGQVIQQGSDTFLGTEWICASTGCEFLASMGLHINPSLFFLISKQTHQIKCYKKNYSSMSFSISISLFCSPIHLAEQASKEKCVQVHKGQEGLVLFFLSFPLLQSFLLMFAWFLVGFLQEKGCNITDTRVFLTQGFPFVGAVVVPWTYSLRSIVFNQPHHGEQMARAGFSRDYQSLFFCSKRELVRK